jgi:hypothetical protein
MRKLSKFKRGLLTAIAACFLFAQCTRIESMDKGKYNTIQQGFIVPNDTNTVWCYYYWIGDDISKEGVTKDMEAMKKFGIGGVLIGNINPYEIDGKVPLFSDIWWEVMVHAVVEGQRLGIDVGFFNCPGWSQSGGPWVTYDKAMRHLVYSEASVKGQGNTTLKLNKPASEFQDTHVLAFRTIDEESVVANNSNSTITCTPAVANIKNWFDGNKTTEAVFNVSNDSKYTVDIKIGKEINARSIKIYPSVKPLKCNVEILAKTEGTYKSLRTFNFDRSNPSVNVGPLVNGPVAFSVPETKSTEFQLVFSDFVSGEPQAGFSEIVISEGEILEQYVEKTLGKMHPTPFPVFNSYLWETQSAVKERLAVSEVIDLSRKMDSLGNLNWDVPEGKWTVLRIGMTPTGTKNSPAAPQGKGYEIDKASAELVRFHFEKYMAEIIKRIPKESLPALKYVIADSYEMGSQNWTDGFEKKFEAKYGYSPVKFLPVFSGRIVGSAEESERFLWDLRRMVADDIAYEYVGGLKKISNENNLKLWLENYGHWGFPSEFLMYGGQSDLIGGEFWNEGELGNVECKSASSAEHIYGKGRTSAEAFTSGFKTYLRHPEMLKKRGDWCFTEGINHFVLHLYIHQPDERIPGINADFATEFNRHNTWFYQGKNWVDYIRRCQHLLQQGKYAADVCYFIGEDVPKMTGDRNPELPAGYSYDYINAEVILDRLTVKDGRLMLPDGMNYGLMVLPQLKTIRPEVLAKIEELINQGAVIMGPKPVKSPSLEGFPACDSTVIQIADRLWGKEPQIKITNKIGKGQVLDGINLGEALAMTGISKDLDIGSSAPVLWTHRTMPGMEIYFLTNQSDEEINIQPSFRVKGLKPQLWDAVTGEIRKLNEYTVNENRTVVPLKLEGGQSWFVVFSNNENENILKGFGTNSPVIETLQTLSSEWTVDFKNKDIGPATPVVYAALTDWTKSDDELIRFYSGTAVYSTKFNVESLPEKGELFINLGNVGVMATVKLNGKELGGTWMAPFRLAIKDNMKTGENTLEIEVVNTWRNQMVKDASLPVEKRYTWTTVSDVKPGENLQPSGLKGPVIIELLQ